MHDSTLMPTKASGFKLRSLQDGAEFPLSSEDVLVGREVECQISLDSGHISRYHAKLSLINGGVVIEDLRSTNGTFINGRRISTPQTLTVGDEVRFHEIPFRLVTTDDGSGVAEETVFQSAPLGSGSAATRGEPASSVNQPSPSSKLAPERVVPEPEVGDDGDSTRLLSTDDLNRLQGKAEKTTATSDNGSGPRLVMLTAPIRGKVYSLISQRKNAWSIGRAQTADFQVSDKTVSAEHARIRKLADEWVLEVCEGRNPIFINNRSVEFTTLHPGDVLRIGRMELIFRTDEKSLVSTEPRKPRFVASKMNLGLLLFAVVVLGVVIGVIVV
jgi:pSer/pThr/pTyr-binding forkhead associated (FHA) protein